MNISPINQARLLNAKLAYTSRNILLESITTLLHGDGIIPSAGDMVLARVIKLGQQSTLELAHGRPSALFTGEEVIVCYGNTSYPLEAYVPADLQSCYLVASGGIAALPDSRFEPVSTLTGIQPIGLLADGHHRCFNSRHTTLPKLVSLFPHPFTIATVGSSRHAGRTAATVTLIRSLTQAGYNVGAAKITGIGSGRDTWLLTDAGAKFALDFTHAGFSSTYPILPEQIDFILETLVTHLSVARMDAIVIEISDDLLSQEIIPVLNSKVFAKTVDSIVFAASGAMSALAGTVLLKRYGLPITAITGRLAESPAAVAETHYATGLPVLDKAAFSADKITHIMQIPMPMNFMATQSAATVQH